jgi:hypothetical protein
MMLCAGLAVVPALIFISQSRLDDSLAHFVARDCPAAIDSARSSSSVLGLRPEPYEVIGYCDLRLGNAGKAVTAMEKAVRRDPGNSDYHLAVAIARGRAGLDPRPQAREARRLNPLDPSTVDAVRRFRGNDRARWRRQARILVDAAFQ